MERDRSSRFGLWIAVILVAVLSAAGGALVNMGYLKPHKAVIVPATPVEQPRATNDAASSWKVFVDEARATCEKDNPLFTVDYTALHEVGEHSYGVMIIACRESEYVVDMFRYDPASNKWLPAPTRHTELGFEEIDTALVSRKWGVSQAILEQWINAANRAAKHKYASRSNP